MGAIFTITNQLNLNIMKQKLMMTMIAVVMTFTGVLTMNAQRCMYSCATVYVFMRSIGGVNLSVDLSANGHEIGSLLGSVKKTLKLSGDMELKLRRAIVKKCILKNEGKVLLAMQSTNTNANTGKVVQNAAEVQLNMEDGGVYYVYITNKGLFDVKFIELDTKKGEQMLAKSNKYEKLPDYIEE